MAKNGRSPEGEDRAGQYCDRSNRGRLADDVGYLLAVHWLERHAVQRDARQDAGSAGTAKIHNRSRRRRTRPQQG